MANNATTVDFHTFGDRLWQIANVFRDDTLKTTEYLEEFSYFLFLKLWDEREQAEERSAQTVGEPYIPYLPVEYRFHNWAANPDKWAKDHSFPDSLLFVRQMFDDLARIGDMVEVTDRVVAGELLRQIPGQRPMTIGNHYYIRCPLVQPAHHLFAAGKPHKLIRDLSLFRRLFQNHTLRVRYAPTIRELCDRLMVLNLGDVTASGWDIFGRAYEYVVNKLGEQKQYGQYFTPRHIVNYMVQLIDPEPGQIIYDPASGTAGFLVRAYLYVKDKIERRYLDHVEREQVLRQLRDEHIWGVEKAPDVYKLGLMNMVLHGDGNANLIEGDSLSSEAQVRFKEHADVILTNPPLGPTAQERTTIFEYHIKLYEALFIQHMMNAVKPGGRVATVMKEGLLFGGQTALHNIRRKLVEQFDVKAVISLPNGVFNPYSGAKTSILVFRRLRSEEPTTRRVWFYDLHSDGRDLGATRRPIDDHDGDLPDMLARWRYEKPRESEQSWWADVDTIRANDYNLTAARYAPFEYAATEHEDPDVLINQVMELETEILHGLEELLVMVG